MLHHRLQLLPVPAIATIGRTKSSLLEPHLAIREHQENTSKKSACVGLLGSLSFGAHIPTHFTLVFRFCA